MRCQDTKDTKHQNEVWKCPPEGTSEKTTKACNVATGVATACEGLQQERSECGGEKSVRKFYLKKVCPITET